MSNSRVSDHHKSTQKVLALPYGRARLGSPGARTKALLWGPAATGHPWPDRGWLGVRSRHPHNSTCVQPPVRGTRVDPKIAWLQQRQRQRQRQLLTLSGCALDCSLRFSSACTSRKLHVGFFAKRCEIGLRVHANHRVPSAILPII